MQMRCLNVFIKQFVNMFVSMYFSGYILDLVTSHFIMGNIGKRFDSEMAINKNGRSNLFLKTYRILIYNLWAASMGLVDKLFKKILFTI